MLSFVCTIEHNHEFYQYKKLSQIRAHIKEKQVYDAELANACKLLDEIDIVCKRLFADNANLKYRLKNKIIQSSRRIECCSRTSGGAT